MSNPTPQVQHQVLFAMAGLRSDVDALEDTAVKNLPLAIQNLQRRAYNVQLEVDSLLERAQEAQVQDSGKMRAGEWSFEHGGIFAGMYKHSSAIDPALGGQEVMVRIYVGAVVDRDKFYDKQMRSIYYHLPQIKGDGGSGWFDAGENLDMMKFLRMTLGRHPIFALYEKWMNAEMGGAQAMPFVVAARTVPVKK